MNEKFALIIPLSSGKETFFLVSPKVFLVLLLDRTGQASSYEFYGKQRIVKGSLETLTVESVEMPHTAMARAPNAPLEFTER